MLYEAAQLINNSEIDENVKKLKAMVESGGETANDAYRSLAAYHAVTSKKMQTLEQWRNVHRPPLLSDAGLPAAG